MNTLNRLNEKTLDLAKKPPKKEAKTFKEVLGLYYAWQSKITIAEKFESGIDWAMLEIMHDISPR